MPRESSQADASEESADENPIQRHDLAYDPDQDIREKRYIRRGYRSLIDKTKQLGANLKNVKVSEIQEGLERGNELFDKVKDTNEATLDSRFLIMASDMGAAKAKAMKNDASGFDVDDFVSKLVTFMGGRKGGEARNRERSESLEQQEEDDDEDEDEGDAILDWDKVGRLALAKSHRVPVADFMLGPLSIEPKQRKKVTRPRFEKDKEPESKPQQLTEGDIQRAENETTKNVAMIERILRSQTQKSNMFEFIINPSDFGQSVENLFYLSFLIREGKCAMEFDEVTGEPIIYSCEPPNEEDYGEGVQKQQIIFELDMETWEHAIATFGITKPSIPNRKLVERNGEKWYG